MAEVVDLWKLVFQSFLHLGEQFPDFPLCLPAETFPRCLYEASSIHGDHDVCLAGIRENEPSIFLFEIIDIDKLVVHSSYLIHCVEIIDHSFFIIFKGRRNYVPFSVHSAYLAVSLRLLAV